MIWSPSNKPIRNWTDRRVWVVGASSGIGAALVRALLDAGARVVLSARREQELLAVADGHPAAVVHAFDVLDPDAWITALDRVTQVLGEIDLVVLGAARYDPQHAWNLDMSQVKASYELNVVSVYQAVSLLVPRLLAQRHGGIAMIGSISGYTGLPRAIVYGATKAALQNFSESLYLDLAPKGLSVYLINPGFVQTPMTAGNDFPMPGLMTPQAAATAILKGMAKGSFEIRFPRGFANLLRCISRLPYRLRFFLLHRTTRV
jgi:short-subunit dehydrogenase